MNSIAVSVNDAARACEAAVVAVADGAGELGISLASLFPAVEKDAKSSAAWRCRSSRPS